jgi:hypothetical protein
MELTLPQIFGGEVSSPVPNLLDAQVMPYAGGEKAREIN